MRVLKWILIVIVALVALVLVAALFVKSEFNVSRSVVINKANSEVFGYVKYLKNQNEFSKWAGMDPAMKKTFVGVDGTVGFVSAWESENPDVGKGEQTISGIVEGKRIDYALHFIEPFESNDKAYMTFDSIAPAQTEVTWGIDGKMNYPMNLMGLFMDMDKMLGDDLDTGLANLKVLLEK